VGKAMNFQKLTGHVLVGFALSACSAAAGSEAEGVEAEPFADSPSDARATNALTAEEEATTLKLIDDICGDTWCEGDYDFKFRQLGCDTATAGCRLTLQIFPRRGVPSTRHSYLRSCRTGDFSGFDSLVATAPNGYQSLQPDYYLALTECIDTLETELR